jgi:hypothetical protein
MARPSADADAPYLFYCKECGCFRDMYTTICPVCDTPVVTQRCDRCGYEWRPRSLNIVPKRCPSCKSPYWARRKIRPTVGIRREAQ